MKKLNQISVAIIVIGIAVTVLTSCSKDNEQTDNTSELNIIVNNMESSYKKADSYNDSLIMCHMDSTMMPNMAHHDSMYHHYDSIYTENHEMCQEKMNMSMMMDGDDNSGMMGNNNMMDNGSMGDGMNSQMMMDMKMCDAKMDSLHHSHTSYHPQNVN